MYLIDGDGVELMILLIYKYVLHGIVEYLFLICWL